MPVNNKEVTRQEPLQAKLQAFLWKEKTKKMMRMTAVLCSTKGNKGGWGWEEEVPGS